jgi:hypothetical protein
VLIVWKLGSLNLLEPSGPIQACNGTALPYLALAIYITNCFLFAFPNKKKVHCRYPAIRALKGINFKRHKTELFKKQFSRTMLIGV